MIMLLVACALVVSTYRHFEHTWDEPEHIAAGLQLLDKGIYTYDIQHPPLARIAMAAGPYLAGARSFGEPGPSGEQEGRDLLYRTGKYDLLLGLARLGTLPFLVILLIATWLWTRHYFGVVEAAIAVFFLVTTPPLLGHAALATVDVPVTAMCTLAFYMFLRFLQHPDWRRTLLLGLTAGLAAGTKLSAIPFMGIVMLLWLAMRIIFSSRADNQQFLITRKAWLGTAVAIVVCITCTVFCYGFSFKYLVDTAHPVNTALDSMSGSIRPLHALAYAIASHVPLPAGIERFVWSVQALLAHNNAGHLSYFMEKLDWNGWWDFYIVALGVKTPLLLLVLSCSGFVYLFFRATQQSGNHQQRWLMIAPPTAFIALLIFCSVYSHINIGVRHVFVLYPLMAISAAVMTVVIWKQFPQSLAHGLIAAIFVLHACILWQSYPDYLAYFNVLAGDRPEHILIDSDLDWGQDLKRLGARVDQLHIQHFGLVYRGSADIKSEHLPGVEEVQPFQPITGWIAVSLYAKATVAMGKGFAWLDNYLPRERIGKSIDLYCIPSTQRQPDKFDCSCVTPCTGK